MNRSIRAGEVDLMSSPPSRSQMDVGAKHQDFAESGFGGWPDEKMKTVREAAPHVESKKSPSTTFDNISRVHAGPVYELLGKEGLGTAEFPLQETALVKGEIAFRQHAGGHTVGPDWPVFTKYAERYFSK